MQPSLALQLYTVRDALAQDFTGVVKRVAGIGYAGVETAGFPGTTPKDAARLFHELGLAVPSAHLPLPLGAQRQEALDTAETLGCKTIVSGLGPEHFQSIDSIRRACDQFNQAAEAAASRGLSFAIHNHWWEFEPVNGRPAFETMLEQLRPEVQFEIDTYWVKTGGGDPAAVVRRLGGRAPLLHIKDGPAVKDVPMLALGDGVIDFPSVARAGAGHTQWWIVELDSCATDMFQAAEKSHAYVVKGGLALGRG